MEMAYKMVAKKMKKILNKLGLTKSILRDWRKIAWTQLLWRAKGRKTALLSVVPYKGTCIDCHSLAQIDGSGVLCLNRSWTKSNPFKTLLVLNRNAHLQIEGNVDIYGDSTIYVNENATLIFRGGYMNNRLNISVFDRVEIGRKVYVSENVSIRDSDNHTLMYDGKITTNISAPIVIEDNVWIGMNVTILKGVHIGTGAVIAAGAVVTKDVPAGCLAAGVPAKVIRENISWI
jgi:acetyltransferase-like isoleucine patch superfamily enzyme